MKIVLCIKQVPETGKIRIDRKTGTLIRKGVPSILNPFCEYAMDEAARLKQETGGEVIVLSMGPAQASSALLRCLELGADRAVLISDRAIAGSDCHATAYVLKQAINTIAPDFDIILTGKQAIDGDTAQVPAELAEMLVVPQLYYCSKIDVQGSLVQAEVETERSLCTVRCPMPLLAAIGTGSNIRRMPSIPDFRRAARINIEVLTIKDIGCDPGRLGVKGSPTRVLKIETPAGHDGGILADGGDDPAGAATGLARFIREKNLVQPKGNV